MLIHGVTFKRTSRQSHSSMTLSFFFSSPSSSSSSFLCEIQQCFICNKGFRSFLFHIYQIQTLNKKKTKNSQRTSTEIYKFDRLLFFFFLLIERVNARTQMTAEQIIHSRKSDVDLSQASTRTMCNVHASTWSIGVRDRQCIRGR